MSIVSLQEHVSKININNLNVSNVQNESNIANNNNILRVTQVEIPILLFLR